MFSFLHLFLVRLVLGFPNFNFIATASLPPVSLPHELITEILSLLDVKNIQRFRCVSKLWNFLISDSTFIKMHFKKSLRNPHFILPTPEYPLCKLVLLPMRCLLENPSINVSGEIFQSPTQGISQIVGCCNGLICVLFNSVSNLKAKYKFCFWNPATRKISKKLGIFYDYEPLIDPFKFSFGCDYITGDYKVVALHIERNQDSWISKVRVFSLGDNCWRDIQSFPFVPLMRSDGVHFSGTVNWLSIHGAYISMSDSEIFRASTVDIKQFVMVSLDLSTMTFTQILLPEGFIEVSCIEPSLRVMMDCLCFSHDFKRTEFVIWKMKEFGVPESWTQLFRIEYFNLQMSNPQMENDVFFVGFFRCEILILPLYISEDGNTLILAHDEIDEVIIYNKWEKRVTRSRISNEICLFSFIDYVESLVSIPWTFEDEDENENENEDEGYFLWQIEDLLTEMDLEFNGRANLN